jgi:hypothetical protein
MGRGMSLLHESAMDMLTNNLNRQNLNEHRKETMNKKYLFS